jgi:hypothetical protein
MCLSVLKFLGFIFIFLVVLSNTNCSKGDHGEASYYELYPDDGTLIPGSKVICADSTDCPKSVGMLLGRPNSYEYMACTTFVVSDSESIMATNDHCLPKELVAGSPCDDKLEVTFADGQKNRCQNIIWRSRDGESENHMSLDIAYFSVAGNLNRPALPIDRQGLENNQEVKVYKVDPPSGNMTGTLRADKCRISYGTGVYIYLNSKDSPAFVLLKEKNQFGNTNLCTIVGGNSGSPILDQYGNVKGVVHISTQADQSLIGKIRHDSKPSFLQDWALAVNSSCMPDTNNVLAERPKSCSLLNNSALDEKEEAAAATRSDEELTQKANDLLTHEMQKDYPMFKWKLVGSNIDQGLLHPKVIYPAPTCSLKTTGSDERFRKDLVVEETFFPTFNISMTMDEDMHLEGVMAPDPNHVLHVKIQLEPYRIQEGKASHFKLTYYGGFSGKEMSETPLLDETIQPCN